MNIKNHTRNQKRMYRIHKQEEKIMEQELMIGSLKQEIERLNNIINELEKRLDFDSKDEENHGYCESYIDGCRDEATIILDYLQELKEE